MPWVNSPTQLFSNESGSAYANARMVQSQLSSYGYTFNAICAVLGNIGYESGYNPWMWQDAWFDPSKILASTDTYEIYHRTGHAYGLFQFDEAGQYIGNAQAQQQQGFGPNYSDIPGNQNDGTAQIYYMNFLSNGYLPTTSYPLSFSDFKASTASVAYLTEAWMYNYERGTWNNQRLVNAQYWYNRLSPTPPVPGAGRKMPWIYYLKRRKR